MTSNHQCSSGLNDDEEEEEEVEGIKKEWFRYWADDVNKHKLLSIFSKAHKFSLFFASMETHSEIKYYL